MPWRYKRHRKGIKVIEVLERQELKWSRRVSPEDIRWKSSQKKEK